MGIKEEKRALRQEIRAKRRLFDSDAWEKKDRAITERVLAMPEYISAKTVFCFVSYGGEPETRDIIAAALEAGKSLCVPRCLDGGVMECVLIDGFDCLEEGYKGILEPKKGMPVISPRDIDFAVVPGVAFTPDGRRLGQGGGFYDRFMAVSPAFTCGICHSAFLLDDLPTEDFDQRVDAVITD